MLTMTASVSSPPSVAFPLARCQAGRIIVTLDGRDGEFAGMSQNGAVLSLRNAGPSACRIEALPRVTFFDGAGRSLPLRRRSTGEQTVVPAVVVPAGASVTSTLHWVSGPVYSRSRCVIALSVGVMVSGTLSKAKGGGQFCAPTGMVSRFDQPVLSVGATEN